MIVTRPHTCWPVGHVSAGVVPLGSDSVPATYNSPLARSSSVVPGYPLARRPAGLIFQPWGVVLSATLGPVAPVAAVAAIAADPPITSPSAARTPTERRAR